MSWGWRSVTLKMLVRLFVHFGGDSRWVPFEISFEGEGEHIGGFCWVDLFEVKGLILFIELKAMTCLSASTWWWKRAG